MNLLEEFLKPLEIHAAFQKSIENDDITMSAEDVLILIKLARRSDKKTIEEVLPRD